MTKTIEEMKADVEKARVDSKTAWATYLAADAADFDAAARAAYAAAAAWFAYAEALAETRRNEMSDYNDGQIHGWNGGECPVHPESVVDFWVRDGEYNTQRIAADLDWVHGVEDTDLEIIAFQVTKPYVEPKVIWVNEYHYGACYGYDSEKLAKSHISISTVRIAVKYVEAKE